MRVMNRWLLVVMMLLIVCSTLEADAAGRRFGRRLLRRSQCDTCRPRVSWMATPSCGAVGCTAPGCTAPGCTAPGCDAGGCGAGGWGTPVDCHTKAPSYLPEGKGAMPLDDQWDHSLPEAPEAPTPADPEADSDMLTPAVEEPAGEEASPSDVLPEDADDEAQATPQPPTPPAAPATPPQPAQPDADFEDFPGSLDDAADPPAEPEAAQDEQFPADEDENTSFGDLFEGLPNEPAE